MEITKISYFNKFISNEEKEQIVKNLSIRNISSSKLMYILGKSNINIACIIKDSYGREIIVSSFGVAEINKENLYSDKLDSCDGGLVSCGIYEKNPSLLCEKNYENFDIVVFYKTNLITCGKNMTGYYILEDTNLDIDMAINDCDSDIFQEEIEKYDDSKKIFIPEIKFIEE